MRRARRKQDLGFSGPLWEDRRTSPMEVLSALEQLVREFNENPDFFDETWLQPLLAEGLKIDKVYELLLDGAIRPN